MLMLKLNELNDNSPGFQCFQLTHFVTDRGPLSGLVVLCFCAVCVHVCVFSAHSHSSIRNQLASHSDSQGTLWCHGKTQKILMYQQYKVASISVNKTDDRA